jgi:acetylornithine deacetylase
MARLREDAKRLVAAQQEAFPAAGIDLSVYNAYPALDTAPEHPAVARVKRLAGCNDTSKVAFGTEGGLFQQALQVPVVVCGPGSMGQGHKPDEFIAVDQLERCDRFIAAIIAELRA